MLTLSGFELTYFQKLKSGKCPSGGMNTRFITKSNINAVDQNSSTALLLSLKHGYLDLAKSLILAGADPSIEDKHKRTPLTVAAEKGYMDIIELLLNHGASINHMNEYGNTSLMLSIYNSNETIANYFVQKGASLLPVNKSGNSALTLALWKNLTNTAKLLIENGANVNVVTGKDDTPLILAVAHEMEDIVKLLLEKGANVNVIDRNVETPLEVAKRNMKSDMAALLKEKGAKSFNDILNEKLESDDIVSAIKDILVNECAWYYRNYGDYYSMVKEFSLRENKVIKPMGEMLDKLGGIKLMRKVYLDVEVICSARYGKDCRGALDAKWDGIGEWASKVAN